MAVSLDCRLVEANASRLNERHHPLLRLQGAPRCPVIHTHDLTVIPFDLGGVALRPVVAQAGFSDRSKKYCKINVLNSIRAAAGTRHALVWGLFRLYS